MDLMLNSPATGCPWTYCKDQAADTAGNVTFTVEAMSPAWWLLYRSDGGSGAVFDCHQAALSHARHEARGLSLAMIETIDVSGVRTADIYLFGEKASAGQEDFTSLVLTCH